MNIYSSNTLEKYEQVDEKTRENWENGLAKLREALSKGAQDYLREKRIRSAKTAELSHTRAFG